MTDGIIQKVIAKYIHDCVMGYYNVNLYNKMEIERLKELQEELITEIRNYLKNSYPNELTFYESALIRAIICDNQE